MDHFSKLIPLCGTDRSTCPRNHVGVRRGRRYIIVNDTEPFLKGKMINVHHMYNKGTTPLSHGVGSTHYGAYPCERGVVHLLYMWCTEITSLLKVTEFFSSVARVSANLLRERLIRRRFGFSFHKEGYDEWKRRRRMCENGGMQRSSGVYVGVYTGGFAGEISDSFSVSSTASGSVWR
jgi:hypothetical protein